MTATFIIGISITFARDKMKYISSSAISAYVRRGYPPLYTTTHLYTCVPFRLWSLESHCLDYTRSSLESANLQEPRARVETL